jgi:hypothetical protein
MRRRLHPTVPPEPRDLESGFVVEYIQDVPFYTKPQNWIMSILFLGYVCMYITTCQNNYLQQSLLATKPTPSYCVTTESQSFSEVLYTALAGDTRLEQCQLYHQQLHQTWLANPALVLLDYIAKLCLTPLTNVGGLFMQVYDRQNFMMRTAITIVLIVCVLVLVVSGVVIKTLKCV